MAANRSSERSSPVWADASAHRAQRTRGRETVRRLLVSAVDAFRDRGFHATRVDDIAEGAATSHGTFYLYFSNKEDLLSDLVAACEAEVRRLTERFPRPSPGNGEIELDDLRDWVGQFVQTYFDYADVISAWTQAAATDDGFTMQGRAALVALMRAFEDRIRSDSERRPSPQVLSEAAVAMLERFAFLRRNWGVEIDDEAVDTLAMLLHRGVYLRPAG